MNILTIPMKLDIPMKDLLGVLTKIMYAKLKPLIIRRANGEISEHHLNEIEEPSDFMKEVRKLVALQTLAFERRVTPKPNLT